MSYMRTRSMYVGNGHALFPYAERVTVLANNLSNAIRFRQRQVLTSVSKPESDWSDNEREVMDELAFAIPLMPKKVEMPTKGKSFLSYWTLEKLMRFTQNPDFFVEGLPKQTAQHVIKSSVSDMKAYFKALKEYKKNPAAFTGKPELPGYKRKGGHTTALFTSQDCILRT